jgi:hypothetical protein
MADEIPAWFANTVTEGIQKLVTLSLPAQPPMETISLTDDVWCQTLWASARGWQPADAARMHAAFMVLQRKADRWPAPKHLLDALPPRPAPVTLPPPPLTAAQRERAKSAVRSLAAMLAGKRAAATLHNAHVIAYTVACASRREAEAEREPIE